MIDRGRAEGFRRLVEERVGRDALPAIAQALADKSARHRGIFGRAAGPDAQGVRAALQESFTGRRLARRIGDDRAEGLARQAGRLLHGSGTVAERLNAFCRALDGELPPGAAAELAAEWLHYTFPERYWLWGRWMYAPEDGSGVLVLLGAVLGQGEPGAVYMQVGEAVAYLGGLGEQVGIAGVGPWPFVLDAYMALVYGLYVFMVTGVRTTPEFADILPPTSELARRLLGLSGAGSQPLKEGKGRDVQGEGD